MKVVFLENCSSGKKGEVKEVSDGFAKNFLLPKKIAKQVDASVNNELKQKQTASDFHHEENLKAARELRKKLEALPISLEIKFGDNGKAFGSVTNKEIGDFLESKGIEIDRKKIEVPLPIKAEGVHEIKIKLYGGVDAKVKITVVKA